MFLLIQLKTSYYQRKGKAGINQILLNKKNIRMEKSDVDVQRDK
ncbi:hypothetical protein SDC49_20035 [Lactobacillus sp. R2/2]|nr:hypothetical protein [Lactobacillus sp. R2/2]